MKYLDQAGTQALANQIYADMAIKLYYTVTIAVSDWQTNSSGGFSCSKAVVGILTTDNIIADVVLSTDRAAALLQLAAWECLCDGSITVTANGTVKLWCYNTKPTAALTVGLQVIR